MKNNYIKYENKVNINNFNNLNKTKFLNKRDLMSNKDNRNIPFYIGYYKSKLNFNNGNLELNKKNNSFSSNNTIKINKLRSNLNINAVNTNKRSNLDLKLSSYNKRNKNLNIYNNKKLNFENFNIYYNDTKYENSVMTKNNNKFELNKNSDHNIRSEKKFNYKENSINNDFKSKLSTYYEKMNSNKNLKKNYNDNFSFKTNKKKKDNHTTNSQIIHDNLNTTNNKLNKFKFEKLKIFNKDAQIVKKDKFENKIYKSNNNNYLKSKRKLNLNNIKLKLLIFIKKLTDTMEIKNKKNSFKILFYYTKYKTPILKLKNIIKDQKLYLFSKLKNNVLVNRVFLNINDIAINNLRFSITRIKSYMLQVKMRDSNKIFKLLDIFLFRNTYYSFNLIKYYNTYDYKIKRASILVKNSITRNIFRKWSYKVRKLTNYNYYILFNKILKLLKNDKKKQIIFSFYTIKKYSFHDEKKFVIISRIINLNKIYLKNILIKFRLYGRFKRVDKDDRLETYLYNNKKIIYSHFFKIIHKIMVHNQLKSLFNNLK